MTTDLSGQTTDEGLQWKIGDKCQVYSDSLKKWFHGKIVSVTTDNQGEWLNIQYGSSKDKKIKQVQRLSEYIRPISDDDDPPTIKTKTKTKTKDDDQKNDGTLQLDQTPTKPKHRKLSSFGIIDSALQKWYAQKGQDDYMVNGKGKFLIFVEENEFAEQDIDEELASDLDAEDCAYLDFDENLEDDINKREEMFKILRTINKYGTHNPPPKPKPKPVDPPTPKPDFTKRATTSVTTPPRVQSGLNQSVSSTTPSKPKSNTSSPSRKIIAKVNTASFKAIDKVLGEYYAKLGRNDYFDTDGVGLFMTYVNDNGLDESELKDELGDDVDPADCMYLDFDDNFPFDKSYGSLTPDQKQIKKFDMLKNITSFGEWDDVIDNVPKALIDNYVGTSFKTLKFNMSDKDAVSTKAIYKKQCDLIFGNQTISNPGYMWGLSVGLKNNFPFVQYMMDTYTRHSLKHNSLRSFKEKSFNKWLTRINYKEMFKTVHNVTNTHKLNMYIEDTVSSFEEYSKLYPPLVIDAPLYTINENINDIAQYLLMTNQLIHHILNQKDNNIPFQFDFCIAAKVKMAGSSLYQNDGFGGYEQDDLDDDDDDDDDDDYDDSDDDSDNNDNDISKQDIVGNIETKLKKNSLKKRIIYTKDSITIKSINDDETDDNIEKQLKENEKNIINSYNTFKQKMYDEEKIDDNAVYGAYPGRRRFVGIIDRREGVKKKSLDDVLYWYSPPKDVNNIKDKSEDIAYKHIVPEFYFNTLQKCLIPRVGYKGGQDDNSHLVTLQISPFEKLQKSTLTCRHGCNGTLTTFSYHVVNKDCIKLYIWRNGQYIRFFDIDVVQDILPSICGKSRSLIKNNNVLNKVRNKLDLMDKEFKYFKKSIEQKMKIIK